MLQISSAQLHAFGDQRRQVIAGKVIAYLQDKHPALVKGLDELDLAVRVGHAVGVGEKLGLEGLRAHGYFAALMFRLGPRLGGVPEFAAAISRGKSPDAGLMRVASELDEAAWVQVERAAAGAWPKAVA